MQLRKALIQYDRGFLLLQYELIVDDRCVKLIEELENYTWAKDKKTGEYTNEPIDSYNHVIDALRYAVEHRSKKVRGIKLQSVKGLFNDRKSK